MLWLITVEGITRDVYDPDDDHQREKNCRSDDFARARHFEISGCVSRERYALRPRGNRLSQCHLAIKPDLA
jgi:hypothetical protein